MAAIANIVLGDSSQSYTGLTAGTETSYTFAPAYAQAPDVMTWLAPGEDDTIDARHKVTLSVRQPAKGSQVARVTAKVVVPVMDASSPKVKVGEGICTLEFVIPKRMTATERNRLWGFAANLLTGSEISSHANADGDANDYLWDGIVNLHAPF